MQISVTQNLAVRIIPVNNPLTHNGWGEQQGYYMAFVAGGTADYIAHQFTVAESEWMRGIISESVGYGAAGVAETAAEVAIKDYITKFGALCVADTTTV